MDQNNDEKDQTPWYKNVVMYQIYPRSFKDCNNDGIGDLNGIIEKLDYFGGQPDSLNVGAIWLSPIYASPMKDFGYDVSNHCSIDPVFGTMHDFERLVTEAHSRNIRIIMDFVPNHTSDMHPWFTESRSNRSNDKRDWYIWADPKPDGSPPNDWLSMFSGSAWGLDNSTGQYYLHSFLAEQPDLNWRNPQVQNAMLDVLRFWIEKGVDGFRADAFDHVFKDAGLRDEPVDRNYKEPGIPWLRLRHDYTVNQREIADVYRWTAQVFDEYPDRDLYMVTEDFYATLQDMQWHYNNSGNSGKFAPLNLHMPRLEWSARGIKEFVDTYESQLRDIDWPNYTFGNHDLSRLATRYGRESIPLAAVLLLTLRGLPILYYGDELGLSDVHVLPQHVQDPFEKREPGKGYGRDPERSPVPWDPSENAGFSTNKPWLPVNNDYVQNNVTSQSNNPHSTLSLYKKLIALRNTTPALHSGDYVPVNCDNVSVFAYQRTHYEQNILVMLNFSDSTVTTRTDCAFQEINELCTTNTDQTLEFDTKTMSFTLQPHSAYVLKIH